MKKRAGSAGSAPSSSALGKTSSFKRITTFPGSPPHTLPTMPSNPIWPQSSDCTFLAAPTALTTVKIQRAKQGTAEPQICYGMATPMHTRPPVSFLPFHRCCPPLSPALLRTRAVTQSAPPRPPAQRAESRSLQRAANAEAVRIP